MSVTAATGVTLSSWRAEAAEGTSLVVLHTNDTHSYLDPVSGTFSKYAGQGGVARRASLIREIRSRNRHVLLVDSGDIFQGTPYFNLFGGEIEFKVMSAMRYDVATLGNHDFDNGVSGLVKQLPHASFEFVSANYDVTSSALHGHVRPHTIKQFGSLKVGIFGLGIDFSGLVLSELHEGVAYLDPIHAANKSVEMLRQAGCHFVICLSHLGHRYRSDRAADVNLAAEVPGIDLILGGHTHTFLDEPEIIADPNNAPTMVHQVGCFGIRLGRINVDFSARNEVRRQVAGHYAVGVGSRALV